MSPAGTYAMYCLSHEYECSSVIYKLRSSPVWRISTAVLEQNVHLALAVLNVVQL